MFVLFEQNWTKYFKAYLKRPKYLYDANISVLVTSITIELQAIIFAI